MARNSISNTVIEASKVLLVNSVKLYGLNTYTLATNFISWNGGHNYNLADVALTFGTRRNDISVEVVGGKREIGFNCGDTAISAYDFALLYSAFTAMIMAKVELGGSFPIVSENLQRAGMRVVWFGNDALIYSTQANLIITLKNADVEKVCAGNRVLITNFCTRDEYVLDREGASFCLTSVNGELLTFVRIPECVSKTYSIYFHSLDGSNSVDDPNTSWDEGSMLGRLIDESDARSECLEALKEYKISSVIDSVVSRDDLVCVPTERYADTTNFFGSICYTDKEEIAVAVNFRRGLFVYYPWFVSDATAEREIKVDPSAKFPEFFNVTEGCNRILRYAGTVINRPLTAAQFDLQMFMRVKEAFLTLQLSRIPIKSAFGRIVIPENILVKELTSGTGESLYCLVPVGIVGSKLICVTAEDVLTSITPSGWDLSDAFYDITEVIKNAEHQ